jgi:hypothetical protein
MMLGSPSIWHRSYKFVRLDTEEELEKETMFLQGDEAKHHYYFADACLVLEEDGIEYRYYCHKFANLVAAFIIHVLTTPVAQIIAIGAIRIFQRTAQWLVQGSSW